MTNDELEALGKQMSALSQSPKSDPVLKALAHLVWQQIDGLRKSPGDTHLHKILVRMLREVHNAIAQRRRYEKFHCLEVKSFIA
jgi:hypothetical protein